MLAYVITLKGNKYSEQVANRCIESAKKVGLKVDLYPGVHAKQAQDVMKAHGLKWTWADGNTRIVFCPSTGLKQFPYRASDGKLAPLDNKIGCSMSHYLLWKFCADQNEPILILEHDAVFLRPLPDIEFNRICQINDPTGATPKGAWWSDRMKKRGKGVFQKTAIVDVEKGPVPDGLAGNSAYMIKPQAAEDLIKFAHKIGLWPNDALICSQQFFLEEYYPFITKVQQEKSTTT